MKTLVINGFLGSGKTTFLKKLIAYLSNYKIGVVVNEFGDANLDSKEIEDYSVLKREISHGSIFCSCRYDQFVDTMLGLLKEPLDYIIVETSGFSDPSSLSKIVSFLVTRTKNFETSLVTIVDAVSYFKRSQALKLLDKQVQLANLVIINKIGEVTEEELSLTTEKIELLNPDVKCIYTNYCDFDYSIIDNIPVFDGDKVTSVVNYIDFASVCIKITPNKDILLDCISKIKDKVFRIKGYVCLDQKNYIVEMVNENITIKDTTVNADNTIVILYSTKIIGKKEITGIFSILD